MRFRLALPAVLAILAIAPAAPAAGALGPNDVPTAGALWGAFPNEPGGAATLQQRVGRKLAVINRYVPWNFTNWSAFGPEVRAHQMPLISWSAAPTTNAAAIAAGHSDAAIRNAALQLKALGGPILLRPFYEFDQPKGHPRYIGTPAQVIAAWRRMYTIVRAAGASNVRLVWCPMSFDFARGVAQHYWPGAAYVDWVGADGYNFPGATWRSFGTIFASAYAFAVSQHKPMIVAETASPAGDPRTPAWIAGAGAWTVAHTDLKAVSYFDSTSPKGYNFRLASNARTLAAFSSWGRMAFFSVVP
ncbi:MAG TPA: glycosyl hydrolase [Gaiellales bacterium]|nr:glycosyl hydrolase [Gaiellales bacterium]